MQFPLQEGRQIRNQEDPALRCKRCGKTLSDPQERPLDEMRIPLERAIQALNLLVQRLRNPGHLANHWFAPGNCSDGLGEGWRARGAPTDEKIRDVKLFKHDEGKRERYSPSRRSGAIPTVITGNTDPAMICTSHVERNNLTMRTFLRPLTRLSLGFSKKLANLPHAVALHFAFYNFCRVRRTLRVTPAMEAGITDHVWSLDELLLTA